MWKRKSHDEAQRSDGEQSEVEREEKDGKQEDCTGQDLDTTTTVIAATSVTTI